LMRGSLLRFMIFSLIVITVYPNDSSIGCFHGGLPRHPQASRRRSPGWLPAHADIR
jgi:hypothetical protein